MRRMDIFCASQASTAICMSMDQSSSSPSFLLGSKTIDRHNPTIRDQKRTPRTLPIGPCTSQQQPISPKPYHLLNKGKRSSAKSREAAHDQKIKKSAAKVQKDEKIHSVPILDAKKSVSNVTNDVSRRNKHILGDDHGANFFDGFSDYNQVLQIVPVGSIKTQTLNPDEPNSSSARPSSSSQPEKPANQVVVLRVSLHCKGCEGKVRKHLSRMEGVASFTVDFAAKKVTVVGDVTPLGVLASVSKVKKNAQFWTAPTVESSRTEAKK